MHPLPDSSKDFRSYTCTLTHVTCTCTVYIHVDDCVLAVQVEGLWVAVGSEEPECHPPGYVLTASVRKNLRNLARVVSGW